MLRPPSRPAAPRPPARLRDSQRLRCYRAEQALLDDPLLRGRTFVSVTDMQGYVNDVRLDRLSSGMPYPPPMHVRAGSGSRNARVTQQFPSGVLVIQMPRAMRIELVLLHEVAHCMVMERRQVANAAPHGWQWANAYLELVDLRLGSRTCERLRQEYLHHRVRFTAPP